MKTFKEYTGLKDGIDIKKASMGDVIKDFQSSDAPQFKGKSDKKKKEMAIAAKLSKEEIETEAKEREISHDEYLKHGAGKGGKQWSTGAGKNKKYWTHRKEEVDELYKDYDGKGWVLGTKDEPKPKDKDIVWRSKVHHWDQDVRSNNTRFIIVKDKGKFNMYAKSDKSGKIVFDWGTKSTLDDAKAFASTRKWQEKK